MMSRTFPAFLSGAAFGLASSVLLFNSAVADTQSVQFRPVENPALCIEMAEAAMSYSDGIVGSAGLTAKCDTAEDGSTFLVLENQ